ncbi:MAG TPA: DMT family transporter [Bacteroidia bacterium]|nr:DMT family transporter [Bacteroidia bacterium]
MATLKRAYLQMHIAILLWGFTGIFGKAISMNEGMLVWYRMLISAIGLLPAMWKYRKEIPSARELGKITLVGVVVAFHWILFYGSIKASSVSVALSCFSSISLFTAILDPLSKRQKPKLSEVVFGLAVISGLYIIFSFQQHQLTGILLAVASAFLGALFTVLNKKLTASHPPQIITFYELSSGFIILSLVLPLYLTSTSSHFQIPRGFDILWLLLLGLICTSFAFTISLKALKQLDPFTLNLAVNLEPVYSILLAMVIFNELEMLNLGFFVGALVILSAVVLHSWFKWRSRAN